MEEIVTPKMLGVSQKTFDQMVDLVSPAQDPRQGLTPKEIDISCARARRYIRSGKPYAKAPRHVKNAIKVLFATNPQFALELAMAVAKKNREGAE